MRKSIQGPNKDRFSVLRRKIKENRDQINQVQTIYWALLFFIIIPIFLNNTLGATNNLFVTKLKIDSWLSFWGNYIGGIAAFCAIFIAYNQNRKNHDEIIERQERNLRLEVLPFLDIRTGDRPGLTTFFIEFMNSFKNDNQTFFDRYDGCIKLQGDVDFSREVSGWIINDVKKSVESKDCSAYGDSNTVYIRAGQYLFCNLVLSNCGKGMATDVMFALHKNRETGLHRREFTMPVLHLKKDESWNVLLIIDQNSFTHGQHDFLIYTSDIYGVNRYLQQFTINQKSQNNLDIGFLTKPKLQ